MRLKSYYALGSYLSFFAFLSLAGQEIQLVSDQPIEFDEANKQMIATGEAQLTYGDLILSANRIVYNQENGIANGEGNIRISQEGYRLLAERIRINIETKEVEAFDVRFGSPPLYAESQSASGSNTRIELHNAYVYYREPDKFTPKMSIESFVVENGKVFNSEKIFFEILGLPVWYLPSLKVPSDVEPFRVRAKLGTRGNLGFFTQSQILFPFAENRYTGGNLDLYSDRGILFGPTFRYLNETEKSKSDWFLSNGYINDGGNRGVDIFGQPVDRNRYFSEGFLKQNWGDKSQLFGVFHLYSDPEIRRDFHFDNFFDNQQPDNFLEYRFQEKDWSLSAFMRADPNNFFTSEFLPNSEALTNRAYVFEEKLPEVRFDLHPVHLGGGFYHELSISAAKNGHTFYLTDEKRQEDFTSLDGFYRIQKTIPLNEDATLNFFGGIRSIELSNLPSALIQSETGNLFSLPYPQFHPGMYATTSMDLLNVQKNDFSQTIGDLGFILQGEFFRTWDAKNRIWKIDGLKHVVKPFLEFRHNPVSKDHDLGYNSDFLYVEDTNLPNWDLATRRDAVFACEQTLARVGIKNDLFTKRKDYGSRQLFSWDLAVDYFFEGPFEGDASFLYSEISASPAPWLEVGMFQRISGKDWQVAEWNSRVRVKDADIWYLEYRHSIADLHEGFGYLGSSLFPNSGNRFPFLDMDQHSLEFGTRLNSNFRLGMLLRYDFVLKDFTEQHYSFFQKFGRSVELEYRLTLRENTAREDDWAFRIGLELISF